MSHKHVIRDVDVASSPQQGPQFVLHILVERRNGNASANKRITQEIGERETFVLIAKAVMVLQPPSLSHKLSKL